MKDESSYKIVDSLFDSLKGFIVLGLCGRTGSGCSRVSEILSQDFSQLNLPIPSEALGGSIKSAEELILYNYAKKNWMPFYQIKVSRLMVGYLLNEHSKKVFMEYLEHMFDRLSEKDRKMIQKAVENFYEAEMEFVLPEYFVKRVMADFPCDDAKGAHLTGKQILKKLGGFMTEVDSWNLLFPRMKDEKWPDIDKIKAQMNKEPPFEIQHPGKYGYRYEYDEDNQRCIFYVKLRDMQGMMEEYASFRQGKRTRWNNLLYWMLYEYAYNVLPQYADELLGTIGKVQRGLPTMILQDIGINLRTWGEPLVYDVQKQKIYFKDEGFFTIIRRINLYLKILRDYLQKQKEYRDNIISGDESSASKYAECLELLNKGTKHVVVVIDSIKNPFESMYLKARYSSYYLTAIYTDEAQRYKRLEKSNKGFTLNEIRTIDTIEQLKEFKKIFNKSDTNKETQDNSSMLSKAVLERLANKLKCDDLLRILPFITQNVEQCIESADIFINNHDDNIQYLSLKKKLIRYISLIMNPGLVLPTPIERCMQIAQAAKACSGCISRQVGAVITDSQYQIRSIGWNDVPFDRVPCIYRDMQEVKQHWNLEAYSDFENDDTDEFQMYISKDYNIEKASEVMQKKGKRIPYCFKDVYNAKKGNKNQVHPRALHAEERAFLGLADQGGVSIKGGYLFSTSSPCELCTKKLCFMGISKVYYVQPYSGISYKHIMCDGLNGQRPVQELFTGALGRAYTYLYTPILSQKDELELWLGFKLDGVSSGEQEEHKLQLCSEKETDAVREPTANFAEEHPQKVSGNTELKNESAVSQSGRNRGNKFKWRRGISN